MAEPMFLRRPCGDGVEILGFDGKFNGTELVIPEKLSYTDEKGNTIEERVVRIGKYAFRDCKRLTSVVLPKWVAEIGFRAFDGCASLESIALSEELTDIGCGFCDGSFWLIFSGCSALKEILAPEANDDYRTVDGVLFSKSGRILLVYPSGRKDARYVIPNGVAALDSSAFRNCKYLKTIALPNTLKMFGEITSKDLSFGDLIHSDLSIGDVHKLRFDGCPALEQFEVSEDNPNYRSIDGVLFTEFGECLVAYPIGRKDAQYSVPKGVLLICDGAFENCKFLKSVLLPVGLTKIGEESFSECSSLNSIAFPESLTEICA